MDSYPNDIVLAKKHIQQFLEFCRSNNLKDCHRALNSYLQNLQKKHTNHTNLIISKRPNIKAKLVIAQKKINDYQKFIDNCRNNGFCVQIFDQRPAIYTDYIHCPNSKLVVGISQVDCKVIKYKVYNIVVPTKSCKYEFEPDVNPIIDEQQPIPKVYKPIVIELEIIHWGFQNKVYLVELGTQKVYLNNTFVGLRNISKNPYYIEYIK